MGYALFAQKKLVLCGLINAVQLQQTDRSNEQLKLSTNTLTLQSKVSRMQEAQSNELSAAYEQLAHSIDSSKFSDMTKDSTMGDTAFKEKYQMSKSDFAASYNRQSVDNEIKIINGKFDAQIDAINYEIKMTSLKENALEMEIKRLDTRLTALQQQLEKVEDAEGKGIEKAVPKFSGIG